MNDYVRYFLTIICVAPHKLGSGPALYNTIKLFSRLHQIMFVS